MYAIYEKKGGELHLFEDEDEKFLDLNEAEEILRQLRKDNPGEYEQIASLRDGIRSTMATSDKGLYVFCEATYPNLKSLGQIYHQHNMQDWVDRRRLQFEERPIPKVVCSEALV